MTRARLRSLAFVFVSTSAAACGSESPNAEAEAGDEIGTTDTQGESESGAETDTQGDGDGDALRPNWHQDLAPVIHASCVGCHVEGGIAPFGLDTYAKAAPWAPMMDEVVSSGLMPPWGAIETDECQPSHDWRNDLRLPEETKQLFADWLAQGTPEGDPADAVPLPVPPSLELQNPTAVLQNPAPFEVVGPQDSFVCVAIDPGVDQDVWITGVQMVPDNIAVVHHVLMYVDSMALSDDMIDANGTFPCEGFVSFDGSQQIGTWVPGAVPTEMPEGVGLPMPAGSRIILAYHYHPNGAPAIDQSSVALRWTETAPEVNAVMGLFGNGQGLEPGPNDPGGVPVFMIPANVADHTETMSFSIPDIVPPIDLFTVGTHMHYVGVDMRVWIERDGQEICLIQTPRWDFNWQRNYDIDAPIGDMPKIQGGDVIKLRCTYDNTLDNPFLVKALAEQGLSEPKTVVLGESSLDEMCLLLFGVATNLPIDQF
ncbi:hypothetical protein ACNOYE_39800 [Nannocystaceae bacterium ST9]